MEDVEKAYIAGLFDGEGCPSMSHSKYKRKGRERLYWNRSVFFVITNEDKRVLKEAISLLRRGRIYPSGENAHNFMITKPSEIVEIAKLIQPYVRVKKPDLDNLRCASEFLLRIRGSGKRHTWTEEEENEFHRFCKINEALKGGKGGRPRIHPL